MRLGEHPAGPSALRTRRSSRFSWRTIIATYTEFLRVLAREGKPRRFTYVCGAEGVLVEDVVDRVRQAVGADQMNRVTLFAGHDSPATIWTEMGQYALDSEMTRLITVRDADRMQGWDKFEQWLIGSRYAKSVHVLMVSNQRRWPPEHEPETRARLLRSSQAMYVQCEVPRNDTYQAIAKIIPLWNPIFAYWPEKGPKKDQPQPYPVAVHLAERTGGNLARCRDVAQWIGLMKKLEYAPTDALIDTLTEPNEQDSFVSALLRVDKKMAFRAAPGVRSPMWVVSKLTTRLNEMDRINRALKIAMQGRLNARRDYQKMLRDTSSLSGLPLVTVAELYKYASHYDARGISRRSELLCFIDEYRDNEGAMEVLAAEW